MAKSGAPHPARIRTPQTERLKTCRPLAQGRCLPRRSHARNACVCSGSLWPNLCDLLRMSFEPPADRRRPTVAESPTRCRESEPGKIRPGLATATCANPRANRAGRVKTWHAATGRNSASRHVRATASRRARRRRGGRRRGRGGRIRTLCAAPKIASTTAPPGLRPSITPGCRVVSA